MNWENLGAVEAVLDRYGVRPILAVIPSRRDPKLAMGPTRDDFWQWVRQKQSGGWHIGLHGFEHLYHSSDAGILPFHRQSEFAGLPYEVQRDKIAQAVDILGTQDIKPTIWVAPGHSFDYETLRALRDASDIRMISDGIAVLPYSEAGMLWLPQQRFVFSRVGYGVETICLHTNWMTPAEVERMERFIGRYSALFKHELTEVAAAYSNRKRSALDDIYRSAFFAERQARGLIRKWIHSKNGQ